jgi:hypothetical protein
MCIACDKEHFATPEESMHMDHHGNMVMGVNVADYTYVIDMYKGLGPGPVCKKHTRDEISNVKEKDLYTSA